jgi:excisionase family DNA binding protein
MSSENIPVLGPFLIAEEVAIRLRCSLRTVHELTRTRRIPHRKLPGSRRCLFRVEELVAWESGTDLDVQELPRGGRVVRPVRSTYAQ